MDLRFWFVLMVLDFGEFTNKSDKSVKYDRPNTVPYHLTNGT
jgi:hypothetical protein